MSIRLLSAAIRGENLTGPVRPPHALGRGAARRPAARGLAVLTAVAMLSGSAVAAQPAGAVAANGGSAGVGHRSATGGQDPRARQPEEYPNVFAEAGYSQEEIDARVEAAWQQLFHGAPGTQPDRSDGQTVYYELAPDMAYVQDIANRDVRSEGIGFAMMIAVQLDHRTEFDKLWNFAKTKMQLQSGSTRYFFAWHTDPTGRVLSTGIAPDGDQWIAAALAFASNRWGDGEGIYSYRREAEQIVRAMWHQSDSGGVNMFDRTTHLPYFSPPGVVNHTDPSYCLPAFYKIFAELVPEDAALWNAAYTAAQQLLQRAAHPQTGLVPSYSNFDGTPYRAPWDAQTEDAYGSTFQEDAWRAIANVNVDAAWFGVQPWQTQFSNKLEQFFESQGITTYLSRYRLDGTPVVKGQNDYEPPHAEGLVAMNSTSAISATHGARLEFVHDFWNTPVPSGLARYYDGLLYLLGLLYDSGKFRIW